MEQLRPIIPIEKHHFLNTQIGAFGLFLCSMKKETITNIFAILLLAVNLPVLAQKIETVNDRQIDVPVPYNYKALQEYKGIKETSLYLTMRDGVKLAVNVYLPKGIGGKKIPTILYQTRYWRSVGFRWPINGLVELVPTVPNFKVLEFVKNGYALVTVDVRGTGASFGTKGLTLPDWNEVQDGAEIVDWIINQPWSDGKVGATGISYIGNTALYLTLNQHPAVKAIAPMYSVFDLYDDIGVPGGIFMERFLSKYGRFCGRLDKNDLSRGWVTNLVVKGVEPVKGERKLYKQAIAQHDCNYYQLDEGGSAEFIDATYTPDGIDVKYMLSPHQNIERYNNANIPIYSYSGWWDLAFTHAAVKQYLNFTNSGNKLILGPWSHGGAININPYQPGPSEFDHLGEITKFFDHYLKDADNGLDKEASVHYFTMGENKWKSSNTWPPSRTKKVSYFIGEENGLGIQSSGNGFYPYITNESTETGKYSRWNLSRFAIPKNGYPDRAGENERRICFSTAQLTENIEVTGHPVISLFMTSSVPDVGVFAYLQDVDENGKVYNITEGSLRAIHRKVYDEPLYYKDAVPYHSYKKEDAMPLSNDKPGEVVFDFYPTSYLFKKGHSIRIAICGNDANYFKQITPDKTEWKIYFGEEYPSKIELPIMDREKDKAQN